jgi:hypothetical protein
MWHPGKQLPKMLIESLFSLLMDDQLYDSLLRKRLEFRFEYEESMNKQKELNN